MKLVLIEWLDSHGSKGWQTLEELELVDEPLKCRSVGWLFYDGADCKVIIPHIAGEKNTNIVHQCRGDLVIPTRAIIELTIIKEK